MSDLSIRWEANDSAEDHDAGEPYAPSTLMGSSDLFGGFYFTAYRVHDEPAADLTQRTWDERDDDDFSAWGAADSTSEGPYRTVEIPGFVGRWVVFGAMGTN